MRASSRRAPRLAASVIFVLSAPLLPGCGDPMRYDVGVSWIFVDGRGCQEAAAPQVLLQAGREPTDGGILTYPCTAGQGGASVVVTGVLAGDHVYVVAISAQGAALYRGTGNLDATPQPALAIPLFYTAGR